MIYDYLLSNQKLIHQQEASDSCTSCYGDFIAPKSSGVKDYIGLFAVGTGFGLDSVVDKYKEDHDEYSSIMAKVLLVCFIVMLHLVLWYC